MKRNEQWLWFAMTSPDPQIVETCLLKENDRLRAEGKDVFQFFIPYSFLERRIVDTEAFDDEDMEDPRSTAYIRKNNGIRAALKRYIFIKSKEEELKTLLTDERTRNTFKMLWWVRDRNRHHVTVPTAEMEQFINACCDVHLKFEICPSVTDLKKHKVVKLKKEGFEGREAWILDIRQVDGHTEMVCGFHIFDETALLKISHLTPEDVIVPIDKSSTARENNNYKIIEDIQRKVFQLWEHHIHPVGIPESTLSKDAVILGRLNGYRYREFPSLSLRVKHCALMLLCTVLSGDVHAQKQFIKRADALLREIGEKPEDKSPKDVTAYLHSVLFLATDILSYYEKAKRYFIGQPKLSGVQLQLMVFMEEGMRKSG